MERVGLAVLLSVYVLHSTSGSCPQDRYGFQCAYSCNCPVAMCNSTDGCRSRNCNRGWSGPTCQKQNKALHKQTSASSMHIASSKAVDGNTIATYHYCFHSVYKDARINVTWWRVDLIETTLIHDVTIYFRTDPKFRRNGIQIYRAATADSPTGGVNCYNVTGKEDGSDIPDVLNVSSSGNGRYLVLYTTTKNSGDPVPILDFCEVQIHVCAPGTFGSDCDNFCHCAGDVCNSVNGICPSGVCLPGWHHDQCDSECTQGSYGQNCSQNCSDRNCKGNNSSCDHATGMCVGGCKAGWNGTDCTQKCIDSYGDGCAYQCSARNCSGTSICDHVTGKCENGCKPRWKGGDCIQECIKGVEYGSGCVGICSTRMCDGGTNACPQDTGHCESTCLAGWQGEDCAHALVRCPDGRYGPGCTEFCSSRNCKTPSPMCDVNGSCTDGCREGWQNADCRIPCPSGTYGSNCSKSCDSRECKTDRTICDHVTGACTTGCREGWIGTDCTQRCKSGTYGPDCTRCGYCDVTCNVGDGHCPGECLEGFTGYRCDEDVRASVVNIGIIGGAIGVAVTLLLGGGLMMCLLKRGRSKRIPANEADPTEGRKTTADYTEGISTYTPTPGVKDREYTELNDVTKEREEKSPYDVIQNQAYENNQV